MGPRLPGWPEAWAGCALLLACLALEQGPQCGARQYEQGGRCCSKCPPGHRVDADCSAEANTTCLPCGSGYFQAGWTRERHCTPHTYCDQNAGFVVQAAGSALRNAECRCRGGTHCSSRECQTCRQNTPCGPGMGVLQEASPVTDTVCAHCPEGSFSDVSSATARCQPWSSCRGQNRALKANGTRTSDVVCGDEAPLPREGARRTHFLALLLVPLVLLLVTGTVLLLRRRRRKRLQELPQAQVQQPAEVDDEMDECPTLPMQETLLGGQPVAQEDGKDSRLAEQERV